MSVFTGLCIGVVGATGAAGSTVLRILEERGVDAGQVRAFASAASVGRSVGYSGTAIEVAVATEDAVAGLDVVFLAAGATTARRLAPATAAAGGLAVDKSSAFRADPAVPLVVPEVNGEVVTAAHGILANPNCVATPLSLVLAPLQREFGVLRVTLATYQSATGAGRGLDDELREQTRAEAAGEAPVVRAYPHPLHGNVVPGGWAMEGDDTEEESKVIAETRRVLGLPRLALGVTSVRVPVSVGHSAAMWVELAQPADPAAARRLLAEAPGVEVLDDPEAQRYPTPRAAAGGDTVLVGRIRADAAREGGLALFWSCDNLRKGAALNAVQVAELALARRGARVASG